MLRPGFFRRDVENVLRLFCAFVVVAAFALTLGWGYEQRQQAQEWRELACAYRVADLASRAKFLGLEDQRGACERLQSLGLGVRTSGLSALPVREPLRY
jgi:predicted negative regulator of RcsB-dependent stress response